MLATVQTQPQRLPVARMPYTVTSQPISPISRLKFDLISTRLLRQRLIGIGHALMVDGLLDNAEDIFYLSPDEIHEATTHCMGPDWRSLIASRKQ